MEIIDIIDNLNSLPYVGDVIVGQSTINVVIRKDTLDDKIISEVSRIIGQRHYKIFGCYNLDKFTFQFNRKEYGK